MNNGEGKESGLKGLKPVASSLVSSSTLSLSPVNTSHITSIFSSLGIFLISMPVPLCPSPPPLCLIHLVPQLTKLFAPFILRFNNSVAKKHMQRTLKEWLSPPPFFKEKFSQSCLNWWLLIKMQSALLEERTGSPAVPRDWKTQQMNNLHRQWKLWWFWVRLLSAGRQK